MTMNKLCATAFFTLGFTFVNTMCFANKPEACPSIEIIKIVGVNTAIKVENSEEWWVMHLGTTSYDTPQQWSFVTFLKSAANHQDAITKANAYLPSMVLIKGPTKTDDKLAWKCIYKYNEKDFSGIAMTPVSYEAYKAVHQLF